MAVSAPLETVQMALRYIPYLYGKGFEPESLHAEEHRVEKILGSFEC